MVTASIIYGIAVAVLIGGSTAEEAFSQEIVGYNESKKITVKSQETYCSSSELELTEARARDIRGNSINRTIVGSQVLLDVFVISNCGINNYPILTLFEVRDADGLTKYFAYQNSTLSFGEETTIGSSWLPDTEGNYQIRVLSHACLRCSGDFGRVQAYDFSVTSQST